MTDRITNDDTEKLLEKLSRQPLRETRLPSDEQIRTIIDKVREGDRRKGKRLLWITAAAVLACLVLVIGAVYVYDMPGGIADRRLSQAAGVEGTWRIPIGRTPEEAVQKFRHFPFMQVVHKETVDGGVLLFIKRDYQKDGTDLQLEYVRKTWLGYKWVWGGGYGIGHSKLTTPAINFMSLPRVAGIEAPFPIVFGEIVNPSIHGVNISTAGERPGNYTAKTYTDPESGVTIWFAILPSSAAAPYQIEALDANGAVAASKTVDDARDFGEVLLPAK
jgi:hypothetical protein